MPRLAALPLCEIRTIAFRNSASASAVPVAASNFSDVYPGLVAVCSFPKQQTERRAGRNRRTRVSKFMLVWGRQFDGAGNMSRLGLTCLMAFLSTTGTGLAVDAVRNST